MKHSAHGIEWNYERRGRESLPPLALVHGFAGSLHGWDDLAPRLEEHFHLLLFDLPGHGETPVPERAMTLKELGVAVGDFLSALASGPVILCGYSMGGRVALHTALFSPEVVRALVLIGASPGIEDVRERDERKKADRELAESILTRGREWFADNWGQLALFASQKNLPPEVQARLRAARLSCDPEGLAYCLHHFGTGRQEYLGRELERFSGPILLMAGERDEKFARSNRDLAARPGAGTIRVTEIAGAGHAAHIENPSVVAGEIISFVRNLRIES